MNVKKALADAIAKINSGIDERIERAISQRDQRWRAKIGDIVSQKVAAAVAARDGHWQAFVKDALETRDKEWREMTGHIGEFPPTPDDMGEEEVEFSRANQKVYNDNVVELRPQGETK